MLGSSVWWRLLVLLLCITPTVLPYRLYPVCPFPAGVQRRTTSWLGVHQGPISANGEVFITERDLKQLEDVRKLLNNTNPDFVIRSRGERRTTLVDIYVGAKDITDLKSKYKKLEFFADFKIITKDNFSEQLQHILPGADLAYLHRNLQIFLVKLKYWCSCIKMQKHLFNENKNLQVPEFEILKNNMFEEYKGKLTTYAQNVLNQEGI